MFTKSILFVCLIAMPSVFANHKEYIITADRLYNFIHAANNNNNNNNALRTFLCVNISNGAIKSNKLSNRELAQIIFTTAKNNYLSSPLDNQSVREFLKYLSRSKCESKDESEKTLQKYKSSFPVDQNDVYQAIIPLTNNPHDDIEIISNGFIEAYVQYMECNVNKRADFFDGVIYQKSLALLISLTDESITINVNNNFSYPCEIDFSIKREEPKKFNTFLDLL